MVRNSCFHRWCGLLRGNENQPQFDILQPVIFLPQIVSGQRPISNGLTPSRHTLEALLSNQPTLTRLIVEAAMKLSCAEQRLSQVLQCTRNSTSDKEQECETPPGVTLGDIANACPPVEHSTPTCFGHTSMFGSAVRGNGFHSTVLSDCAFSTQIRRLALLTAATQPDDGLAS